MFSPDRSRKPSISDIIDVLNIKDEKLSLWDTNESLSSRKSPLDSKVSPLADTTTSVFNCKGSLFDSSDSFLDSKNEDVDSGYSESPRRESPSSSECSSSEEYSPSWHCSPSSRSLFLSSIKPHPTEKQGFFEGDNVTSLDAVAGKLNELYNRKKENDLWLSNHKKKKDLSLSSRKEENDLSLSDHKEENDLSLSNHKEENDLSLSNHKEENDLSLSNHEEENDLSLSDHQEENDLSLSNHKEENDLSLSNHKEENDLPPSVNDTSNSPTIETSTCFFGNDEGINEENLLKLATESVNKRKLSIEAASCLLSSKDDAIIIVLEEDETVKYMSTSRQKLQNFLTSEPQDNNSNNNNSNNTLSNTELSPNLSGSEAAQNVLDSCEQMKRRGRKRVHEPDKSEAERGEKKRERNNEACRKFRKSRKVSQKVLFQRESELLQHNLNLKEQIAALDRQLLYIKEKLGMPGVNKST